MTPFFRTVDFTEDPEFDWENILYNDEGKVNIIQLTLFSREIAGYYYRDDDCGMPGIIPKNLDQKINHLWLF